MKKEDMYIHKHHETREGIIFETSNIGETLKSSYIVFFLIYTRIGYERVLESNMFHRRCNSFNIYIYIRC